MVLCNAAQKPWNHWHLGTALCRAQIEGLKANVSSRGPGPGQAAVGRTNSQLLRGATHRLHCVDYYDRKSVCLERSNFCSARCQTLLTLLLAQRLTSEVSSRWLAVRIGRQIEVCDAWSSLARCCHGSIRELELSGVCVTVCHDSPLIGLPTHSPTTPVHEAIAAH